MSTHLDVPTPRLGRRLRARDAVLCVSVTALLLILLQGPSLRRSGEELRPGWQRTLVLAAGKPAGWLGDRLPLADAAHSATAWLSPDDDEGGGGGFAAAPVARGSAAGAVPAVSEDAFDPRELGDRPVTPRPLRTVLVTGDSMTMPLDAILARRLAGGDGLQTRRDPHVGTAISQTDLVDWGKLSRRQVVKEHPEAVVVFIGANEGFPMQDARGREVSCCGRAWAAVYATRVRQMMATYRQRGAARVYWLLLPTPRDPDRQPITRAVNAAIAVGAQPYRAQARVLDLSRIFTPGARYRDAMTVGGRKQIVREADGIHLNDTGSELAAGVVLRALQRDYGAAIPRS